MKKKIKKIFKWVFFSFISWKAVINLNENLRRDPLHNVTDLWLRSGFEEKLSKTVDVLKMGRNENTVL